MGIRFINLWKYWKKPHYTRDISLIDIDLYDELSGGLRLVVLNIGFHVYRKKS